ncbi:MAG: hypothetical protein M9894_02815 [Planctomycetes bacterium]|nr:hypothetical protein [Planctomycetota bacterium]
MRARPALAALVALTACTSAGPPPGEAVDLHDAADLPLLEGARATLRSDLPPGEDEDVLRTLEALEGALDVAFPFLPPPAAPPRTVVLGDPARFALHAREHGLGQRPAGAFLCAKGEVFSLHEPGPLPDDVAVPTEPVIRPLASAVFRRRLVAGLGADLPETWLEEGLAMVFVEVVAPDRATLRLRVRARERLLDAYLPLFLGGPPALTTTVATVGPEEKRRRGSRALAWAACRFLLDDAERAPLLVTALRRAAGALERPADWDEARARLEALEPAFEAWLRHAVQEEVLVALALAPTPVDRWEAAAALRLLANIDLDPDQPDDERARAVAATREMLAEDPGPPRFLALFEPDLARVRAARSKLQAMSRVHAAARKELERRSQGYGHPAVEAARKGLGPALQRALDAGG